MASGICDFGGDGEVSLRINAPESSALFSTIFYIPASFR